MKNLFLLLMMLIGTGLYAQKTPEVFKGAGVVFTGDNSNFSKNRQVVEFTGNVHFTTDIVEIEKADKIVYDKKTKTFTISGFKEMRLHGKKKLASDYGSTTLKVDLGDCVAYLIPDSTACPDGKGNC